MKILQLLITILILSQIGFGISDIQIQINNAIDGLNEMQKDNLPITRYNDTLLVAQQLFDAQTALEQSGENPDYSCILDKLDELNFIKQKAYLSLDEIKALEIQINQTKNINITPVIKIYNQAQTEFKAERYEKAIEKTKEAKAKISELQATEAKIKAFYSAINRNISTYVKQNYTKIILWFVVVAFIIFVLHNPIICWLIERKIEILEKRKKSVRKLIAEAQKQYFQNNKLSEVNYHIKVKKYGEIIRDINRQIPLLKEMLGVRMKRWKI